MSFFDGTEEKMEILFQLLSLKPESALHLLELAGLEELALTSVNGKQKTSSGVYASGNCALRQPDVFRSHSRMTRRTFELLVHMIGPSKHIPKGNSFGRTAVDPRKQIAMSLWMVANQETHRQIADRFDVSLSSVSRCFRRVCKALVDLLPDLVKWPNGRYYLIVQLNLTVDCFTSQCVKFASCI